MKKSKSMVSIGVVVIVMILLAVTCISGIGAGNRGAAKNIKLGLDLAGGVSITYRVKNENPSAEDIADTIWKLQKRVEQYSNESSVYQEGSDRINIEIPGVSDANTILNDLGQPGSLYFIAQKGSDGTENYSMTGFTGNAAEDYTLNKTIEELKEDGSIVLTGEEIKDAQARSREEQNTKKTESVVSILLNESGTAKFAEATKKAYAARESIGIFYDGSFVSVPNVNAEITDGQAEISGANMTYDEASVLASTIRIGGLKLELEELRSNVVGAQLGEKAIETSLKAGVIGLIIVFLFMIMVYLLPGLVSSMALLVYTGLVLVIINAFDVTLTLPGIAGVILGIGMAVDANVIIFARVREEISWGKSIKNSLKTGFQKAMSAIVDGNITTLIAAAVLWILGSGTVRGFAQTLAIGILVSMFTSLIVTRVIIFSLYELGAVDKRLYYHPIKERQPIPFLSKRKIFICASAAAILIGFIAMGINGASGKGALFYSIEFKGGTSTNVTFNKDYSIEEIDSTIVPIVEKVTGDANVQTQKVAGSNQVIIKTVTLDLEKREALNQALVDNFQVNKELITAENISSTVSSEMRRDAIVAVIVASICMLLYIWMRFKDIKFAASAVLALLHDVLVVLAFYAVARVSVGNTFIACMLTILGYSINATIVIFDRIREEMKGKSKSMDVEDVVNKSITQTLTRSIYTSLTTFVMVFVLYIMGVSSIREFAAPLIVGIVCGGYSSVCLTGALWFILKTKMKKRS